MKQRRQQWQWGLGAVAGLAVVLTGTARAEDHGRDSGGRGGDAHASRPAASAPSRSDNGGRGGSSHVDAPARSSGDRGGFTRVDPPARSGGTFERRDSGGWNSGRATGGPSVSNGGNGADNYRNRPFGGAVSPTAPSHTYGGRESGGSDGGGRSPYSVYTPRAGGDTPRSAGPVTSPWQNNNAAPSNGGGLRGGGSVGEAGSGRGGFNGREAGTPSYNRQPRAVTEPNTSGEGRFGTSRGGGTVAGNAPVTSWRPPSRGGDSYRPGGAPRGGGFNGGVGAAHTGHGDEGGLRAVTYSPSARPPRVDFNHYYDRDRHDGGHRFTTVDVGFYEPRYRYHSSLFFNVGFYFPYYYDGPFRSGFYYSPFYCYDSYFPTYIYPERVIVVEKRVYLHDVVSDDDDDYLYGATASSSLRDSMEDIRAAWQDGNGGLLLSHINEAVPVRVYQKGEYKYSLEPEDFRDVTKDALNRVETVSFEWTNVDKVNSGEVHLEAKQVFRDKDGDTHAVRLTYTLEKSRGNWWITETGTEKWAEDL